MMWWPRGCHFGLYSCMKRPYPNEMTSLWGIFKSETMKFVVYMYDCLCVQKAPQFVSQYKVCIHLFFSVSHIRWVIPHSQRLAPSFPSPSSRPPPSPDSANGGSSGDGGGGGGGGGERVGCVQGGVREMR